MQDALIVHWPALAARELVLLFHGVGGGAEDLRPLGEALGRRFPGAWVVSVRSPDPSYFGAGWQWFSGRVIAIAGRFAQPPRIASAQTALRSSRSTGDCSSLPRSVDHPRPAAER